MYCVELVLAGFQSIEGVVLEVKVVRVRAAPPRAKASAGSCQSQFGTGAKKALRQIRGRLLSESAGQERRSFAHFQSTETSDKKQ